MSFEQVLTLVFTLLLITVASWRTSRALINDQVFEGLRDFVSRRFPTSEMYYEAKHVKSIKKIGTYTVGRVKAFPMKRWAQQVFVGDELLWVPAKPLPEKNTVEAVPDTRIGYLFSCMDCMPVYTSAVLTFGFFAFTPGTSVAMQALIWLTSAALASVIEWKS